MLSYTHSELIGHRRNVKIHDTAVIGQEGFGFRKTQDGAFTYPLMRNPHDFKVIINDGVEIGPLCVIDRGSWRDTIIGESCKLDSGVKVAHNVIIHKECLIVAGAVIGGSCEIGERCFLGMNCCIKQHTKIGNHCIIDANVYIKEDVMDYTIVTKNRHDGSLEFKDVRLKDKWKGMCGLK